MKLSLLEIVYDIMNDMDADLVSSIDDTVESQQVAQIVKTCYFEMMGNRNWPHLKKLLQLESSNTSSLPTHLKLPENAKAMESIRYNKMKYNETRLKWEDLKYKDPESFLTMCQALNSDNENIDAITDVDGTQILVYNDRAPTFWTSFDDEYIVCDAYDKEMGSTLLKKYTQAFVYVTPSWDASDDFVPDLPEDAFPALVAEAKSTAFFVLKQEVNQKAEQKATRQQRWLSRKARRTHSGLDYPDYGRKSRK